MRSGVICIHSVQYTCTLLTFSSYVDLVDLTKDSSDSEESSGDDGSLPQITLSDKPRYIVSSEFSFLNLQQCSFFFHGYL